MTLARAAVTAALALCLAAAVRAEAWLPSSADRVALERREVVVHSAELPNQPASERGREVRAAIRIRASAARIFAAMTHCETALQFVPKLRKCVLIERDPQTGAAEILAAGRLSKLPGGQEAEFSMLVSDHYQRRGVGTELLRRLLAIGRSERLQRVVADILPENDGMRKICHRLGFRQSFQPQSGVIRAEIDL